MSRADFEDHAQRAVGALGPARVRAFVERVGQGWPDEAVLRDVPEAAKVLAALRALPEGEQAAALTYLRGLADGYRRRAEETSVEAVWSGPRSHRVPVRSTARVLTSLVAEATRELALTTYSATPYPPLTEALTAARERGVAVSVVVETLQGAGSALEGTQPYAAFLDIPGVELWHWPVEHREEPGSRMHAKLAVADRRVLLVSSANLTQSGVANNIEAGLLIRGGTAPTRTAEHLEALRANGTLTRLS
ncbi:DISARM system phospholipase D-like protein DrmC [Salinactinospora qingdaonensis]|uniref:phospholipase D n=1 Tax=Salinactinospora qingdaonensis TaxID=702744 RepID=A0ABP7G9P9_9ACTN